MCHQTLSRLEHCGCGYARLLRPYNSKYSLVTRLEPLFHVLCGHMYTLLTSPHKEMYIINRHNYVLFIAHLLSRFIMLDLSTYMQAIRGGLELEDGV